MECGEDRTPPMLTVKSLGDETGMNDVCRPPLLILIPDEPATGSKKKES